MQRLTFLFFAIILPGLLTGLPLPGNAAVLPDGLVEETVGSGWDGVAGVVAGPNADGTKTRVYGWEAGGKVWIVEDGVRLAQPLVDISAEVGAELSLLGFALDPAFQTTGHIYLLYTVDRNVLLGKPGRAPTIGRVTRYTCRREDGFTSVDPASRKILIGETKSTGIPLLERSHTVGALVFGEDGSLLVSTGDGAGGSETEIDIGNSPNALQAIEDGIIPASLNIGAWRSQSLDAMCGKILRINPETGDGIADNPFYQTTDPRSSKSRVWAYGLRNPFRFAVKPGSGSNTPNNHYPGALVIGDAGWNEADSVYLAENGGHNFGWPAYEGYEPANGYRDVQAPSFVNVGNRTLPVASWTPEGARARNGGLTESNIYPMYLADRPVAGPDFNGRASIGGTFIDSDNWPLEWSGRYLHLDWGLDDAGAGGWVRAFSGMDPRGTTSIQPFGSDWYHVSHLSFHKPSASLYYVIWPSTVKRSYPAPGPPVSASGLKMEVFSDPDLTSPAFSTFVPSINFVWDGGGPRPDLTDNFSIRWTGQVTSGSMNAAVRKFIVDSDDGIRVYIDGQLLLDRWDQPGTHWQQESLPFTFDAPANSLSGPRRYDIRVEYREITGFATAALFWTGDGLPITPVDGFSYQESIGDTLPPVISLSAPAHITEEITVDVSVSEVVTGLTKDDFTIMGGAAKTLIQVSETSWRLTVQPYIAAFNESRTVMVSLPAGICADTSGNLNPASNTTSTSFTALVDQLPDPGLLVNYFTSANLPSIQMVQPLINGQWPEGTAGPVAGPNGNAYYTSVWNGFIRPESTGTYYFTADVNDSIRLTIGWQVLLNNWSTGTGFAWQLTSGGIQLEAGKLYPIRMIHRQNTGDSLTTLYWHTGGQAPAMVPASAFFQPPAYMVPQDPGFVEISGPSSGAAQSVVHGLIRYTIESSAPLMALTPDKFVVKNGKVSGLLQVEDDLWYAWVSPVAPGLVTIAMETTGLGAGIGPANQGVIYEQPLTETPPSLTNPGRQRNSPGQYVRLPLAAADAEGSVYVEVSGLPPGLRYFPDSTGGFIEGTLPAVPGSWLITIKASDNIQTVQQSFFWDTRSGVDNSGPTLNLTGPSEVNPSLDPYAPFSTIFQFSLIVEASEAVSGLTASDFVLVGCYPEVPFYAPDSTGFGQLPDGRFRFNLRVNANNFSISLPAGSCVDAWGNSNVASNLYAGKRKSVVSLLGSTGADRSDPWQNFFVYASFRRSTIGVDFSQLRIANGEIVSFQSSGGSRDYEGYAIEIHPTSSDDITIWFPEEAYARSNTLVLRQIPPDTTKPEVNIRANPEFNFKNRSYFDVIVTVSEGVRGLGVESFKLSGCVPDPNYGQPSGAFRQTADGNYVLHLSARANSVSVGLGNNFTDYAGNRAVSGYQLFQTRWRIPAALSLRSDAAKGLALSPGDSVAVLQFYGEAAGLTPASFTVTNGSVLSVSYWYSDSFGSRFYRAVVRPTAAGDVSVVLAPDSFKDTAGISNAGTSELVIEQPAITRAAGVTAEFFKDATLTESAGTVVVPNVNFDWALGSPAEGVPDNQFSARFTGCVVPPVSGAMKFYVRADDGARLWLNGVQQFDHLDADVGEWSADFEAVEGMPVMVKIEFREGWGGAGILAAWSGPGLEKEIISSARWLVNETGLQFPLRITAEEEAAAATSQIPAGYSNSLESLPAVGRSLALQPVEGGGFALSWTCQEADRPWLVAESSADLSDWKPLPLSNLTATAGSTPGYTNLVLKVTPDNGARYFRLRVAR